MKKFFLFLLGLLLAVILIGAAMVLLTMRALAPQPGEWATTLQFGPVARAASVPTMLRWASHPLALPQLDGRRIGGWQLQRIDEHTLEAQCAPCRVQLDALGPQPLAIDAAGLRIHVRGADRFDGTLRLGAGAEPVSVAWRAELKRDGLQLQAELQATPLARVLAVFGDALPEARQARIDGSVALRAEAT